MIATKFHHTEIVNKLIKYKANVNATDKTKHTSLHIACQKGFLDIVSVLLANGADVNCMGFVKAKYIFPNVTKVYFTPLYYASKFNHFEISRLLLKNGAIIDYTYPKKHIGNENSALLPYNQVINFVCLINPF